MEKGDAQSLLEELKIVQDNTKYILDEHAFKGIGRIMKVWFITYAGSILFLLANFLFVYPNMQSLSQNANLYFSFVGVANIILFALCIFCFILSIRTTSLSFKEKESLLLLFPIIVLLSLSQMVFPLSYYFPIINNYSGLYQTIPIDVIATLFGILILYTLYKNRNMFLIIFIDILYICIIPIILSTDYYELICIINFVNQFNLVSVISFLLGLYFIKRKEC